MGLCSDAPSYPRGMMKKQIESSERLANRYLDQSEQQQAYWQDMFDQYMLPMMEETFGVQSDVMRENLNIARADRARYADTFQPIEDDLIREFQSYDSTERQAAEAGRAKAAVQQAFEAQRANAEQRLASYGIDPSQIKSGAVDLAARVKVAAAQAQAGTDAARRVEDTGRALRAEAINIGRGMPSNVAASYGQTLNAGNSAVGNVNATMGQGANMLGTGAQWGQMGSNQLNSTMSGINNMYSGQLAGYDASGGAMGALGNIAGQAFGAWAGSGFAEGGGAVGVLPNDNQTTGRYAEGGGQALPLQNSDLSTTPGPNDAIPVTLAEGEYIIPKDVVMRMGTEKLDKLIESTRQKAGEAGGANSQTPAGEMPNPEPPIKGQTLAAEAGGAVGYIPPAAIAANPDLVTPNYAMTQTDPFVDYRNAAAMQQQGDQMNFKGALQAGAKTKQNYDEGKGLPGAIKDWLARRKTVEQGKVAMQNIPADLSTSGAGSGNSMMGK